MEYIPGNELFHLLNQTKNLDETAARFYAAEILSALEDIHNLGIVYKDLKPENLVLDIYGHIKLIDFGLSEFIKSTDTGRETSCGSEGYISPEAARGRSCSFASDFYSLGIVIHEMLSGTFPTNNGKLGSSYGCEDDHMKLSKIISQSARNLIKKLLNRDPSKRLGARNVEDIKNHKWFGEIDWNDIKAKSVTPPFRPSIENPLEYEDILNGSTSEDGDDMSELENNM